MKQVALIPFTAHIDYVKAKIRANTNIFKRLASSRMMSDQVWYRLYNAFISPYLQSILNIYPILADTKQRQLEDFNRNIHRLTNQWHDARNVEVESFPKYRSIATLTSKHWDKLIDTILNVNPAVIEDFLQYKIALVYLEEYLSNPVLANERRKIFKTGRINRNIRKLVNFKFKTLLDHALCHE